MDANNFEKKQTKILIGRYGKDELVKSLLIKLRDAHLSMGKMQAEIDELKSLNQTEISKTKLRKEIDRLRKSNNELITKLNGK